jgi:hypothetical protein
LDDIDFQLSARILDTVICLQTMQKSLTYRLFVRFSALLILIGVLLPSGLHAKILVEFCLTQVQENSKMLPDHSCCESHDDESDQKQNSDHHNHCDWGVICACNISESFLNDEEWVVKSHNDHIRTVGNEFIIPIITDDDPIVHKFDLNIGEYDPPLWLLYDTLLL